MVNKTLSYFELRSIKTVDWLKSLTSPQHMILMTFVVGYFLALPILYERMGIIAGTFVSVPVIAFAYLKGLHYGLLSWLFLGIVANGILLRLLGSENPIFTQGQLSGQGVLLLMMIIIGRMRDFADDAQQTELKARKRLTEIETLNRALRTDIDAYELSIAKLQARLDRQEQLIQFRSRMGMMTSHEFRTPLSLILTSSEILRNSFDQLDSEQRERYFDTIRRQVNQLTLLSDDILSLGKVENQIYRPADNLLNVEMVCQEIITTFEVTHQATHHFHFEVLGVARHVQVDRKFVHHVVTNLLSNAVKYSPAGGKITITLLFEENGFRLRVKDQGVGIREEDLEHLFDLFHRGQNADIAPGTGLGLVIVKQAVEGCGGTIQVDSVIGLGTTFTIRLPL